MVLWPAADWAMRLLASASYRWIVKHQNFSKSVTMAQIACLLGQVGIASVWYEGNPCNMHLLDLADEVKKGVQQAGMVGYRFNTVGVSDAISMGTSGMGYSLPSRDLIADSIETTMGGQWYIVSTKMHLQHSILGEFCSQPSQTCRKELPEANVCLIFCHPAGCFTGPGFGQRDLQ